MLDCELSVEEVLNALLSSKSGKAPGYDEIPVELYKNQTTLMALTRMFNVCYNSGKVPFMWSKGVITPIPKSSTSVSQGNIIGVRYNWRGIQSEVDTTCGGNIIGGRHNWRGIQSKVDTMSGTYYRKKINLEKDTIGSRHNEWVISEEDKIGSRYNQGYILSVEDIIGEGYNRK
ncbi:unnamed protein product [Mytilus coruscus]|uniref:Reverse transcriptase domain-containing protein n=1 Tax=Mytilus coruscus TaxID=42192 RepID=A0A6J8EKV3_MYTCO|nr:unnamed protein product [Mytilus coruscus]